MTESERRSLTTDFAEAVSTQAKVANRAWLSLVTVALFAVLPRVPASDGNISLPWNIGEVSPAWFHTIAFFILAVLAIFFAAAHAQQIRAQILAQGVIEWLIHQKPSEVVHPRELFDMLRTPSLSRVSPLAQLLRGKYQFYSSGGDCPTWLRLLSVGYYVSPKLVSYIVFFLLPVWALWRAYTVAVFPGWWRVPFIASLLVAETSLLQVFVIDGREMIKVVRRLWAQPRA